MAESVAFLEHQMALNLFREGLDAGDFQVPDQFLVSQQLEDLSAAFERPVRVALIGADPALVRRVVSLLIGGEKIEAQHYSEDFRPLVLSYKEAPEAALRWWDRVEELSFDGSADAVEAEQADIICLRGPYDMPRNLEIVDMSGASLASPQLVTFAMKQICDQVIWVAWNKDLATTHADKTWKSVPGVLRKSGAVIACAEGVGEALDAPAKLKAPVLEDALLDLPAAETAHEQGTLLPASAEAIVNSFMQRFADEHTNQVSSEIKALIEPCVGDDFWQDVQTKVDIELAARREAEILKAATRAAANDDAQPMTDAAQTLNVDAETIEPHETAEPPAAEAPDDLRQLWLQQIGRLLEKEDDLSVQVLCDWGRATCVQIINAPEAPVDCKTDCRSAIAFMDSLESDDAEAARMDLISMFCQLANTIGEMTQPDMRDTPADIVEMMTGTIAI